MYYNVGEVSVSSVYSKSDVRNQFVEVKIKMCYL